MTSPRASRALAVAAIAVAGGAALMLPPAGESSRAATSVTCAGAAPLYDSLGHVFVYGRLNLFSNKSGTKAQVRYRVRRPNSSNWHKIAVITVGRWAHSHCVAFKFGPSKTPELDVATVSWSVKHTVETVHLEASPFELKVAP